MYSRFIWEPMQFFQQNAQEDGLRHFVSVVALAVGQKVENYN